MATKKTKRKTRKRDPKVLLTRPTPLAKWLHKVIREKKRTRHDVECTLDYAWIAKAAGQTHCPLTGLPLLFGHPHVHGAPHPLSPSLDRRDPSKPYTPANTRIVTFWANTSRSTMTDSEFTLLVLAAASHMRH